MPTTAGGPPAPWMVLVLSLCVSAGGCAGWQALADRWEPARTTVEAAAFTLESPYDEQGTAVWMELVALELAALSSVLGATPGASLTVKLVPAPFVGTEERWTGGVIRSGAHVKNDLAGHATPALVGGRLYAVVYVDGGLRDVDCIRRFALLRRPVLRHELAHACAFGAVAAFSPDNRWFHEGLATWVATFVPDASGWLREPRLLPLELVEAHRRAGEATLEQILDWDDDVDERTRYLLSAALVRFLVETESEGTLAERSRRVLALSRSELIRREGRWMQWLAAEDGLDVLAAELGGGDPARRKEALQQVMVLAFDHRWEAVVGPRFQMLLRPLLVEPGERTKASLYLVLLADRLGAELVDGLCDSSDAVSALTGLAARARRGEPVDRERAATLWGALAGDERAVFFFVGGELGLQ